MTTTTSTAPAATPTVAPPAPRRRTIRTVAPLAVIAVLTAIAATIVGYSLTGRSIGTTTTPVVADAAPDTGFVVGTQQHLQALVNANLLPPQAVNTYELQVERAVASHLLPAAALPETTTSTDALRDAVNSHLIPDAALPETTTSTDALRDAVNSHLIPPQALDE